MKDILSRCDVNPRVFYKMFSGQEEAFKLAGVPYSDEARSKVEKANVARRFGNIGIIERRPLPPLRVISRDNIIRKSDERYVSKSTLMLERLNNSYSGYLKIHHNDSDFIEIAYNQLSSFILNWYTYLWNKDQMYELAKSLRYSMDPNKYMLVIEGFDFNDLEGSFNKICEKEFKKMVHDEELMILDKNAKAYFKVMLDEVFGSPPDLKSK